MISLLLERDHPGKVIMWYFFHLLSTSQYNSRSNHSGHACCYTSLNHPEHNWHYTELAHVDSHTPFVVYCRNTALPRRLLPLGMFTLHNFNKNWGCERAWTIPSIICSVLQVAADDAASGLSFWFLECVPGPDKYIVTEASVESVRNHMHGLEHVNKESIASISCVESKISSSDNKTMKQKKKGLLRRLFRWMKFKRTHAITERECSH